MAPDATPVTPQSRVDFLLRWVGRVFSKQATPLESIALFLVLVGLLVGAVIFTGTAKIGGSSDVSWKDQMLQKMAEPSWRERMIDTTDEIVLCDAITPTLYKKRFWNNWYIYEARNGSAVVKLYKQKCF